MRAVIADTDDAIGPVGLVAGRVFRPVLPGEIAAITASGFGPTDPPLDPGAMASGPGALLLPVVVVIGDYTLAPEEVNLAIKVKVGDAISPEAATLNGGAPQWGFPSVKLTRRNRWPLGATGQKLHCHIATALSPPKWVQHERSGRSLPRKEVSLKGGTFQQK